MSKCKVSTVGISKNILKDILIGAGVTIAFIIFGAIFGIIGSIGIPSFPASILGEIGRGIIVIFSASIFETVLFFEFILTFFDDKLENLGIPIPYVVASLLTSITFSLFHAVAYQSSLLSMGGSFVSAFVVAFGWCYLRKWTKSLLPLIISHAILNAWILYKMAIVVAG